MKISVVGKIFQRLKFISSIEISMLEIKIPSSEIFFLPLKFSFQYNPEIWQ